MKYPTFAGCTILVVLLASMALPAVGQEAASDDKPVLDPGGPYAATELRGRAYCGDVGEGVTELEWDLAESPGDSQRIDITVYRGGFEIGKYETWGPLKPHETMLRITEDLQGGTDIYWRVLTETPEGWVPSETARCWIAICPNDEPGNGFLGGPGR